MRPATGALDPLATVANDGFRESSPRVPSINNDRPNATKHLSHAYPRASWKVEIATKLLRATPFRNLLADIEKADASGQYCLTPRYKMSMGFENRQRIRLLRERSSIGFIKGNHVVLRECKR